MNSGAIYALSVQLLQAGFIPLIHLFAQPISNENQCCRLGSSPYPPLAQPISNENQCTL